MMFRKTTAVLREGAGTYVDGEWEAGPRSVVYILASAQPITDALDMQSLPEGRRVSDFLKFYTSSDLQVSDAGIQPDVIVYDGIGYEIIRASKYTSGVIPHCKYIGARLFPVSDVADWLSGELERGE